MSLEIKIHDVQKRFGEIQALDKIVDSFPSGALHGLIGPEGAGKTTLLRNIMGLLNPDSGDIVFSEDSTPVAFNEIKKKISYMPQRQSLYPDLSIEEHLNFFKSLYGLDQNTFNSKTKELLEITRLDKFIDRPAGQLSGGMYKKLGLMLALLQSPKILLLDEPTNGVDPISRREFWELLNHLISDQIIIIYATSYMDEAERCDIVHLLNKGRLFSKGSPAELLEKAKAKTFDEYYLSHTKGME